MLSGQTVAIIATAILVALITISAIVVALCHRREGRIRKDASVPKSVSLYEIKNLRPLPKRPSKP